jgi:hypothetical protein
VGLYKALFRTWENLAETHQILKQAFGDNSLGQTQTYNWHRRFNNGRTPTDDDRSGRPSTCITPGNICNILRLSHGTCQRILSEELNMRIAAKLVPRLLQNEQKQHRLEVCREIQQQLQEDPNFLSAVFIGSIRLLFLPQDENQVEGVKF